MKWPYLYKLSYYIHAAFIYTRTHTFHSLNHTGIKSHLFRPLITFISILMFLFIFIYYIYLSYLFIILIIILYVRSCIDLLNFYYYFYCYRVLTLYCTFTINSLSVYYWFNVFSCNCDLKLYIRQQITYVRFTKFFNLKIIQSVQSFKWNFNKIYYISLKFFSFYIKVKFCLFVVRRYTIYFLSFLFFYYLSFTEFSVKTNG